MSDVKSPKGVNLVEVALRGLIILVSSFLKINRQNDLILNVVKKEITNRKKTFQEHPN